MSTSKFETACISGVVNAFNKHYKFTGGLSLRSAPEAFIQGEIAISLSKIARYVTLESDVRLLLHTSGAELRGRQPRSGRIDVTAWWKNKKPRFVIEVKKAFSNESISSDVKRLKQVMERGGSCRDGLVIVYSDASHQSTLDRRFKNIAAACKARHSRTGRPRKFHDPVSEKERYWQAACYRVST